LLPPSCSLQLPSNPTPQKQDKRRRRATENTIDGQLNQRGEREGRGATRSKGSERTAGGETKGERKERAGGNEQVARRRVA